MGTKFGTDVLFAKLMRPLAQFSKREHSTVDGAGSKRIPAEKNSPVHAILGGCSGGCGLLSSCRLACLLLLGACTEMAIRVSLKSFYSRNNGEYSHLPNI